MFSAHAMRVVLLGSIVLALAACGTTSRTFVSDLEDCGFEAGECSPEQASHASLEELHELGSMLVVMCEASHEDDLKYPANCRDSVRSLVESINARFGTAVRADLSEVHFEEFTFCSDTFIPGRESADCAYRSIKARVRLHWSHGRGA
jgi:hypothetical protein